MQAGGIGLVVEMATMLILLVGFGLSTRKSANEEVDKYVLYDAFFRIEEEEV